MKLIRAIFEGRSAATPSGGASFGSRTDHRVRWWPAAPASSAPLDGVRLHDPDSPDPTPASVQHQQSRRPRFIEEEGGLHVTTDSESEMVAGDGGGGGGGGGATDDYDVWSTTAAFPPDDGCHSDASDQCGGTEAANGVRRSRRLRSRTRRRVHQRHVTFTVAEDRYSNEVDDTELRANTSSDQGEDQHPAVRRTCAGGGNPLLETISAIEDLHPSDDECSEVDGGSIAEDDDVKAPAQTTAVVSSDGERDSTGYSSSNSMDSGYKSSCPALAANMPGELPADEPLPSTITGSQGLPIPQSPPHYSLTYPVNSFPVSSCGESGVTMVSPSSKTVPMNRLDNGFYDVNLDHLMYLRQSLLGGATTKKGALPVVAEDGAGVVQEQLPEVAQEFVLRLTTGCSGGGTKGYLQPQPMPRTVGTLRTSASKAAAVSRCCSSDGVTQSSVATSCSCPCCGNPTVGEDGHDTRAEYYDLENVNEFPCAYGTMVENRFNNSCLARVKKLKESSVRDLDVDGLHHQSSGHFHVPCGSPSSDQQYPQLASTAITQTPAVVSGGDYGQQSPTLFNNHNADMNAAAAAAAAAAAKQNRDERAHVSEVTKCILKIIDDIQLQQQHAINEASAHKPEVTKASAVGHHLTSNRSSSSSTSTYDSRRLSGADYHVYEEIAYGLTRNSTNQQAKGGATLTRRVGRLTGEVQYVNVPSRKGRSSRLTPSAAASTRRGHVSAQPPPLPARPNEIFGNSCAVTGVSATVAALQSSSSATLPRPKSLMTKVEPVVLKNAPLVHQSACQAATIGRRQGEEMARRGGRYKSRKTSMATSFPIGKPPILLQSKGTNDDDYGFKLIKTMT